MGSQTSLKTSQRGDCNPLNPPPGSACEIENYLVHIVQTASKFTIFISLIITQDDFDRTRVTYELSLKTLFSMSSCSSVDLDTAPA